MKMLVLLAVALGASGFTPAHLGAQANATTPQGHVLINSDLEASVPLIRANVEKISHAHWDHNAGSAAIKTLTGAKYMVMDADVPVVESGYRLVNNAAHPQTAADYERTFRVLKSLPCDIFLGAHGSYFNLDTDGYREYVAEREQAFRTELAKQKEAR